MTMATDSGSPSNCKLYGFLVPANEDELIKEITIVRPDEADEEADSQDEQIGILLGGIDFDRDARQVLVVRPTQNFPGLMGYYAQIDSRKSISQKNIRATCFAMACGMLNARFVGPVVLLTMVGTGKAEVETPLISLEQFMSACKTPDIRPETLTKLGITQASALEFPPLLTDGVMNNYHDRAVLSKFNRAMSRRGPASVASAGDSVDDYIFGFSDDEIDIHSGEDIVTIENFSFGTSDDLDLGSADFDGEEDMRREVVTQVPLCLHCRRPATTLCQGCQSVYFCEAPRKCRQEGWSHDCLCATWKLYCEKREELGDLPLESWAKQLTTREFQLSNEPYENYLNEIGIKSEDDSWWKAEFGGWSGGMSDNAQRVNLEREWTFQEGFAPITDIPSEQPVPLDTLKEQNWDSELGLRRIKDWAEYYQLRGLSLDSPAGLLLTFPLTLYHAIVEYCKAPIVAARMNQRPLRIDVVGAEKELHFLSLFQETAFLLPEDLTLELVFVVRRDMMPPSAKAGKRDKPVSVPMKGNLRVKIVGGTYGESIDPRFDCGRACAPDAVIAFNAGLYAYESWRSAVEYLHVQKSVIGIFTDYNEWSGVQCASLGGQDSRLSLKLNPFRQPRAMPVYSMNLPQVGNGFMYVFNQHKTDG